MVYKALVGTSYHPRLFSLNRGAGNGKNKCLPIINDKQALNYIRIGLILLFE